jgi:2-iminobutanoate/2-iminopropanoate deaminase
MSKITRSNPAGVHPPVGFYSHAVSVPAGARRIVLSGQVGVRPDGSVPDTADGQAAQIAENIKLILASEGATPEDVVKMTTFIADKAAMAPWREHRAKLFGEFAPASTLLVVAGLADPRFMIEVELEAAGDVWSLPS